MKTSNPYGANYQVKVPPETISSEMSQASGKAKARYPDTPRPANASGTGNAGKMKRPAYTPGGPAGS